MAALTFLPCVGKTTPYGGGFFSVLEQTTHLAKTARFTAVDLTDPDREWLSALISENAS
jgi:hypothetical protein